MMMSGSAQRLLVIHVLSLSAEATSTIITVRSLEIVFVDASIVVTKTRMLTPSRVTVLIGMLLVVIQPH